MTGLEIARLIIGIIGLCISPLQLEGHRFLSGNWGNIISFCLFASPMPTFVRIVKNKSVEEFKSDPYLAAVLSCMFWVLYGLPLIHPDSTLVITINSTGLAIELSYLVIFCIYCDNNQRRWILGGLAAQVVFTACIAIAAIQGYDSRKVRSNFVGVYCVAFGISLYASPLTVMKKVIKTKSVEYMPFWISVASFANGVIWTIYSCLKFDPFIFTGNSIGILLGAAQLILYWYYYKETPKKTLGAKQHQPTTQELQQMPTEV